MSDISKMIETEAESLSYMPTDPAFELKVPETPDKANVDDVLDLSSTEDLNLADFVAKMAELQTDKKRVCLDLVSLVDLCQLVSSLTETNNTLSSQLSTLSKSNEDVRSELDQTKLHVGRLSDDKQALKDKIKTHAADKIVFRDTVNEKLIIIEGLYMNINDLNLSIANKDKELADYKTKLAAQNRKIESYRTSELDKMLGSQRSVKDMSGLGYNDMPHPFNSNYTKTSVDSEMADINPETKETNKPGKLEAQKNVIKNLSSDNSKTIPHTKVHFVQGGVIDDTKTDEMVNKEHVTEPLVPKTPVADAKVSKSRKQMSCFKCRQKGHVASCCPNKKQEASHKFVNTKKTPTNSSSSVDRLGSKPGLGSKPVNIRKRGGNHSVSPPKPKRAYTQTENTFYNQRNKSPSRFNPPSRNHSQFENGSTSSAQGNKFVPRRFNSNSPQRQKSIDHKQSQSPTKVSKTLYENSYGYFKEVQIVDDKGQTKTVMAWIPLDK